MLRVGNQLAEDFLLRFYQHTRKAGKIRCDDGMAWSHPSFYAMAVLAARSHQAESEKHSFHVCT